jgi:hypothetical protein
VLVWYLHFLMPFGYLQWGFHIVLILVGCGIWRSIWIYISCKNLHT